MNDFSTSFLQPSSGATLEWIQNETVIQTSPSATATSLHLSLLSVGFGHTGQYSCRARLSGGRTEGPVNAGYLRVLGRCAYCSHITIQQAAYC